MKTEKKEIKEVNKEKVFFIRADYYGGNYPYCSIHDNLSNAQQYGGQPEDKDYKIFEVKIPLRGAKNENN